MLPLHHASSPYPQPYFSRLNNPQQTYPHSSSDAWLVEQWQQWAAAAPHGQSERRDTAAARLEDCLERGATELDLSSLKLSSLPPLPPQLEKLILDNNRLTTLPLLPEGLRYFSVSSNRLSELPEPLPAGLTRLQCRDNLLAQLPEAIHTLPAEAHIFAEGNPLNLLTLQRLMRQEQQAASLQPTVHFSLQTRTALAVPEANCSDVQALEALHHYPVAEAGMTRQVILLPVQQNERNFQVELLPGKVMAVDGNRHCFPDRLEKKTVDGWGYDYYVVGALSAPASTMMAFEPGKPTRREFVPMVSSRQGMLRYNSKLPIVVYTRPDTEVRYRIWRTDEPPQRAEVK